VRQYLDLLARVLHEGTWQNNRTGIRTKMLPGAMMQFDLGHGFPVVTTKKLYFDVVKAELLGFVRGYTSAADFRKLGCKIWDANANDNVQWLQNSWRRGPDDLGRVYGVQWRDWQSPGASGGPYDPDGGEYVDHTDQLGDAVREIVNNPQSRRIIVTAWNPAELNQMALPPCHLLFQFLVTQHDHKLHLTMYQRSCDLFLGVPFNIASYALLLELVAEATGYTAGTFTHFLADAHIYENHLQQVEEQLSRKPLCLPELAITHGARAGADPLGFLESIDPVTIKLVGYEHWPALSAPMAV
jgi:thymidylate synthase